MTKGNTESFNWDVQARYVDLISFFKFGYSYSLVPIELSLLPLHVVIYNVLHCVQKECAHYFKVYVTMSTWYAIIIVAVKCHISPIYPDVRVPDSHVMSELSSAGAYCIACKL